MQRLFSAENPMYIHIKVVTNARKESFVQESKDHFLASVKEKAERNVANARIVSLVAGYFDLPVGKVRIINGHHSPSKLISVDLGA